MSNHEAIMRVCRFERLSLTLQFFPYVTTHSSYISPLNLSHRCLLRFEEPSFFIVLLRLSLPSAHPLSLSLTRSLSLSQFSLTHLLSLQSNDPRVIKRRNDRGVLLCSPGSSDRLTAPEDIPRAHLLLALHTGRDVLVLRDAVRVQHLALTCHRGQEVSEKGVEGGREAARGVEGLCGLCVEWAVGGEEGGTHPLHSPSNAAMAPRSKASPAAALQA